MNETEMNEIPTDAFERPLGRLDVLYLEARSRFESWAAIDAPHLPVVAVDAMQVRLARWQTANFGAPRDVEIALGAVEELGETYDATDRANIVDGIGDVVVYLGQLFTSNRLAIGPALVAANEAHLEMLVGDRETGKAKAVAAAGYLAHVVLKRAQRIRGMADDDEFRRALFRAAVDLVVAATDWLAVVYGADSVFDQGGAPGIYLAVGETVLARDWKKDPLGGQA